MLLNEDRASKLMEKYDIDVLVATSPHYVSYATESWVLGHWSRPTQTQVFAILPKDGEPTLIQPRISLGMAYYEPTKPRTKDVRFYGLPFAPKPSAQNASLTDEEKIIDTIVRETSPEKDAITAFVKAIKEKGFENKVVGIDELGLAYPLGQMGTPSIWKQIEKFLPKAHLKKATHIWREISMVKTDEEIRRITKNTEITLKAIRTALEAAEPGATEEELDLIVKTTGIREGARVPWFTSVSGGGRSAFGDVLATPYKLASGDILKIDCGFDYQYYKSDIGRTIIVGEPTSKKRKLLTGVARAQERAVEQVKPGIKAHELFDVAMKVYNELDIPYVLQHAGHGVGLETYCFPLLRSGNDMLLEENMIISVETSYSEVGFGGMLVEDTILVTESGHKSLTKHSKDFPFV